MPPRPRSRTDRHLPGSSAQSMRSWSLRMVMQPTWGGGDGIRWRGFICVDSWPHAQLAPGPVGPLDWLCWRLAGPICPPSFRTSATTSVATAVWHSGHNVSCRGSELCQVLAHSRPHLVPHRRRRHRQAGGWQAGAGCCLSDCCLHFTLASSSLDHALAFAGARCGLALNSCMRRDRCLYAPHISKDVGVRWMEP